MARLIVAADDDMVNASVYGRENESVVRNYLVRQAEHLSARYHHISDRLIESAQNAVAWVNDRARTSRIDRFLGEGHGTDRIVHENRIMALRSIHDYRDASPATVRWVMCHPVIREQAVQGNLHAWGITDVDVGELENDWYTLNDGVQQEDGSTTFYQSSMNEGGHELSDYERGVAFDNLGLTNLLLTESRLDFTNNEAASLPNRGFR